MRKAYITEKWYIKKVEANNSKYYQIHYLATGRGLSKIAIDNIATYAEALNQLKEIKENPNNSSISSFDKKYTKVIPKDYSKKYIEDNYTKEQIKQKSMLAFSNLLKKIEEKGKNFIHEYDAYSIEEEDFDHRFFLDYLIHFNYVESYSYYTLQGKGFRNYYYKVTEKGKAAFLKH